MVYYYLDIDRLQMARASLFSHPFALVQLGQFIREAMVTRQEAKRRPVVLYGPKDAAGNITVVGVSPKGKDGNFQVSKTGSRLWGFLRQRHRWVVVFPLLAGCLWVGWLKRMLGIVCSMYRLVGYLYLLWSPVRLGFCA